MNMLNAVIFTFNFSFFIMIITIKNIIDMIIDPVFKYELTCALIFGPVAVDGKSLNSLRINP